jgi:hypothetical protein
VSETRKNELDTPLDRRIEKALAEWPTPVRAEMDWDEAAAAIEEKLRAGAATNTMSHINSEKFLQDPLPPTAEEGHNTAAVPPGAARFKSNVPEANPEAKKMGVTSSDRERTRSSLKDLARLAAEMNAPSSARLSQNPLPPSGVQKAADSSGDSGVVDMQAISQSDPNAAARAQTTPLASAGLFDDDPASAQGPLSQRPSGVHSLPPASGAMAAAAVPQSAPPASLPAPLPASISAPVAAQAPAAQKKGGGAVIGIFGGVVALAAIAAGAFFFIRHQQSQMGAAASVAMNEAPKAAQVAPATPTATAEAPKDNAAPPSDTVDPSTLAVADNKPAAPAAKSHAGAHKPAAPAEAKQPSEPKVDPKLVVKDTPPPPGGVSGSLGDAMKAAAGPSDTPQQQAQKQDEGPQFAPGSVPQKPSQGAVTGAIGAVLPGARACLGPDDPVSRATVTFGSTGTVQSVTVHGAAAGKPAEGCIKNALGKAKVPPFAESTYIANITVRPN